MIDRKSHIIAINPAAPVSLAEFKAQARIDTDADETTQQSILDAAIAHIEDAVGTTINARTLVYQLAAFPTRLTAAIELPEAASGITSVTHLDAAGSRKTVDPSVYEFATTTPHFITVADGESWPETATEIEITYVVVVNPLAKQAVLMLAAYWYDQRETASDRPTSEVPHAVDALILKLRGVLVH